MKKILLLMACLTNLSAQNFPSLETDRPDVTESAAAVEAGYYQIEANLVNYIRDGGKKGWDAPALNIKKGLEGNRDIQLVFSTYSQFDGEEESLSDLGLRLKQELVKGDSFNLGILPYVITPEMNRDLELGVALPGDLPLTESVAFAFMPQLSHYDSGWTYLQTLAIGADLTDKLGVFAELVSVVNSSLSDEYYYNYGTTYLLNQGNQIDMAVNHGFNSAAVQLQIFLGYTVKFRS